MQADLEFLSEQALLVRLGESISMPVNARVHQLADRLRSASLPALEDLVPAYASLLVRFDAGALQSAGATIESMARAVASLIENDEASCASNLAPSRQHRIPVCYEADCAPDLQAVAAVTGLDIEEVVRRHHAPEYRVAMLGFAPGFAYLLGLDPVLAVPRRDDPRTCVPAGSVAIGGEQTGIYPTALPGGWQLIGRTPLRMFDPSDPRHPCRLLPGDRVRFFPVDKTRMVHMQDGQGT